MKKLIPAAVLIAFTGAANAELSLYGLIDMSYGKSLLSDLAGDKADFHSGGDNGSSEGNSASRFGLRGSTDVGQGIKVNFKLESGGIDSDGGVNGGDAFFARQAWAGFSGGFGEVRLGRQDSVSFQTMIDFDFNGASNGVSALGYSGVGPWLPGRQSRSLQYISPNMGGLTAQVGFVPKGNGGTDAKDVFSAGVKYVLGAASVAASLQTKDMKGGEDFMSLAAMYDFGVAKAMVGYADGGKVANGGTGDGISLGFVAPVAGFNIGAMYGKNSDDDAKIDSYELFINKEIFKGTYAYAEMGKWKSKAIDEDATGYAIGVIFTF